MNQLPTMLLVWTAIINVSWEELAWKGHVEGLIDKQASEHVS